MKILLVDDHALMREALRGALTELESEATIFEASDGLETMQFVERNPDTDLVLLDLSLPDRDGFSVLAEIRQRYPTISNVVISASQDRRTVMRALELGALGFIPKTATRKIILSALRLVFSGGIYIPPQALPIGEPAKTIHADPAAVERLPQGPPPDPDLTERQLDVLALLMRGKSNKAICRTLNLAEPTIKHHVRAILRALKATNRTEAVVAAGRLDLELAGDRRRRRAGKGAVEGVGD